MTAPAPAPDLPSLLAPLEALVRRAGAEVMAAYAVPFAVERKADGSPVTAADRAAEAILAPGLAALLPGVPVVAEEAMSEPGAPPVAPAGRFWLVDPLDGTREFVARNGEFTVNVALVDAGLPVLGAVLAPALDLLYLGVPGLGAWRVAGGQRSALAARAVPPQGLSVAYSRSHRDDRTERWLSAWPVADRIAVGSALKFGLLAAGQADVYPRLGPTMEWDTAAGHAVLAAAGGCVLDLQGQPLRYGKPGYRNPDFVAGARAPGPTLSPAG
ncbi:MAG: 3'(2'),5'-bisphosphate nucleotidase CysQ [Pseudomonadota bacterium]